MTRVLIPTMPDDIHAAAIRCALERKGHQAVALFASDLPSKLTASVRLGDAAPTLVRIDPDDGPLPLTDVGTVWMRRPSSPVLPDHIHPDDRQIAARELDAFSRGLWGLIAPDAFWVNPIDGVRRASSKLLQLREAMACGLRIPDTLASNDPAQIRAFLRSRRTPVIYKPFRPSLWTGPTGISCAFTSVITEDDLPDDETLRLTPGIFQPLVAKRHELRATYIGDRAVTVRLKTQDDDATRIDWRGAGGRTPLTADLLPDSVDRACRALMRRLGIVFGCFDFIVTPTGDLVFLEVNEAGQWLWIEETAPELRLLDLVAELLAAGRSDFAWPGARAITFAEVEADARELLAAEDGAHVAPPRDHLASEGAPGPDAETDGDSDGAPLSG